MTKNRQMAMDLTSLIIKLNDEESEELIDDIQDATRELSFLDAGRGIEILVAILSEGKYTNTNIGEWK